MKEPSPQATAPRVSVVVPTRGRTERLRELLESLRAQTLEGPELEVIVAHDGPDAGTAALLEEETRRGGLRLTGLSVPGSNPPAVKRNAGWREASAPLVALTDDDCVADPQWLLELLAVARTAPGAFVQGRTDPRPDELYLRNPFSRTVEVGRLGPFFQTCNILYPRELLQRVGGFDELSYPGVAGEDTDLAMRCLEEGAAAVFAPEARVFHAVSRLGPLGKLRVAGRWGPLAATFARHPELRRTLLVRRIFWKRSHYLLARAVVGATLPRQARLLRLWLAFTYLADLVGRGRIDGGGPVLAPYWALHDVVEMAALARGSVRYRTLVL